MSSPFTEFNPIAAAMSILLLASLSFLGVLVLIDHTGTDTSPEMNSFEKIPESSQDTNETGDESEELAEESEELAEESEELADDSEDTTDYTDMPGLIRLTSCGEHIPQFTCDDSPDAPSVTDDLTDEEDRIIGKKVNRFLSNTINELLKIQQDRKKRNKTE